MSSRSLVLAYPPLDPACTTSTFQSSRFVSFGLRSLKHTLLGTNQDHAAALDAQDQTDQQVRPS